MEEIKAGHCPTCGEPFEGTPFTGKRLKLKDSEIEAILTHRLSSKPKPTVREFCDSISVKVPMYWRVTGNHFKNKFDKARVEKIRGKIEREVL